MNEAKQKVMEAKSPIELLRLFRAGFEFEFHELNGVSRDDLGGIDFEADVDSDLLLDRSIEALSEASDVEILDSLSSSNNLSRFLKDLVAKSNLYLSDIKSIAEKSRRVCKEAQAIDDCIEEAMANWRSDWENHELENNPEDYYPRKDESYDIPSLDGLSLEVGSDSSVRGGEIRTEGGLTIGEFYKCAKAVFHSENEWRVDSGCSFHIHLSVPSVKHAYGESLQASMIEYLLNNVKRLPISVRKRLNSSAIKWCKPQISQEKYSMIHFHSQGTWEFRLFGNIADVREAMACLLLACEAMQYAYHVQATGRRNVHDQVSRETMQGLYHTCLEQGIPLYTLVRSLRVVSKINQNQAG
jgi:hypothetical protein